MSDKSRWLIILIIMISVITTTCILNIEHDTEQAVRLESSLDIDDGDLDIDWSHYPSSTISLKDSVRITQSGTYRLTGSLADGNITIDVTSNDVVRLILDNVTINSSNGPAIACLSGDDLVIELEGENTLTDGTTYLDSYDEDVTAAIYSKADLTFTGEGSLSLTGNYQDAIVSKDDLTFRSGIYNITSSDDAIRGKDSVRIVNGKFTIDAVSDAIKSTNDIDSSKGFIQIENGSFNLVASAKGIKATNAILVKNGNYSIDTTDDSIHSDNYIDISDGTFNINSSDDAVHANRELTIDGGTITIAKSYEGLEAQIITINDGDISILASDDGINAGGGADNSALSSPQNRNQKNPFNADENCVISINGGNLHVNSAGDGIDSNGWLYFNDGKVTIDGPTNNGNGSLDAGMGIIMNGGEVIALGSSGMAENLGQTSSVHSISIYLDQIYPANTLIEIKNHDNETLISYTSAKSFSHLAIGTPVFALGESYTLYLNNKIYTSFVTSNTVTTNSNQTPNNNRPTTNNTSATPSSQSQSTTSPTTNTTTENQPTNRRR